MTDRFFVTQKGGYVVAIGGGEPEAGSVEVPERPSDLHVWDRTASEWVAGLVSDADRVLTRPQFAFLLALTGFDDVWEGLETVLKDASRAQYAVLKAERSRPTFRLDRTLAIVAQFSTAAAQIAPDVDLSEDAIRAAWAQAETFTGAG